MSAVLLFLTLLSLHSAYHIATQPSPSYNLTASQEIVKLAAVAFCG